ncbi:MAG: NapC/NirT family cytochrome c [Coriobacteriia bacterium]
MRARRVWPWSWTRISRVVVLTAVVVVIVSALAVAIPLVQTATPEFFARYHLLERRYVNLSNSAHEGIGCRACHETQPVANGLALIGDYYTSFVKTSQTPRYFTFGPPSNTACLACHEDDWSTAVTRTDKIPHPAHQRVASETRDCVGCHKWTAHFETYMDKHKSMPFSGVCVAYGCHVGTKTTDECFDCHHVLHESAEQWKTEHVKVVQKRGESVCLEACHTVGQCQQCHTTGVKPEFTGLKIEIGMKSIEALHVKSDWTEKYHGAEALKDRSRCLLCHQSEGECDECHLQRPAFHGSTVSWIGRHSKYTTKVDDPACIECHKQTWCAECHDQFKEME